MHIVQVDIYIYKHARHYRLRGVDETPGRIAGTDYFFEPHWRQSYSAQCESCLIKITYEFLPWGE